MLCKCGLSVRLPSNEPVLKVNVETADMGTNDAASTALSLLPSCAACGRRLEPRSWKHSSNEFDVPSVSLQFLSGINELCTDKATNKSVRVLEHGQARPWLSNGLPFVGTKEDMIRWSQSVANCFPAITKIRLGLSFIEGFDLVSFLNVLTTIDTPVTLHLEKETQLTLFPAMSLVHRNLTSVEIDEYLTLEEIEQFVPSTSNGTLERLQIRGFAFATKDCLTLCTKKAGRLLAELLSKLPNVLLFGMKGQKLRDMPGEQMAFGNDAAITDAFAHELSMRLHENVAFGNRTTNVDVIQVTVGDVRMEEMEAYAESLAKIGKMGRNLTGPNILFGFKTQCESFELQHACMEKHEQLFPAKCVADPKRTILDICSMVDDKLWDMHTVPEGVGIRADCQQWLENVNRDTVWLSSFYDNLIKVPHVVVVI